jgi:hypothetical protein
MKKPTAQQLNKAWQAQMKICAKKNDVRKVSHRFAWQRLFKIEKQIRRSTKEN